METQEQLQWDDVNKLLQHHGFKPVCFTDPVENTSFSDLTLLDKKSAGEMRTTLKTMLTDSERRQALIQELIKSNNQLKEEVQEHMRGATQQSQRATELEELLDVVRTRVQDLEDRCLTKAVQQHSSTQQLQQEKQQAQKRCGLLELELSNQREDAAQLERKLYFTIKEEERRLARHTRMFQQICHKVIRQDSPADRRVLDVVDYYETRMTELLEELRSVKGEPGGSHQTGTIKSSSNVTPSFKTILKAYQQQQKESKGQIEELKKEVELLKTRLPREDDRTETSKEIEDQASLCAHYHHLLTEIRAVVTNPSAPFRLHRHKPSSGGLALAEFQTCLPTLEVWAHQLHLLEDLQRGLYKLSSRLMPWQPSDGSHDAAEPVKVETMMLLVDNMLENSSTDDEKVLRSPTRYTLGAMVSHFQKLFDVTSLSGVYPRMNEVYARLGEMTNAMRNLRDLLQLGSRAPPAEVVTQVGRLVSSSERSAGFHQLLGDADIDSIIVKVKQHEEFFPPFHALITDILQTLGVSHLDDILPALKSLMTL